MLNVPLPNESHDVANPAVFLPLLVCTAPNGVVVFTVAARPAFDDGTVQDWAEHLAKENNLRVERVREARVNRMPCVLMDATMPSDAGLMRSRSVFLEDGGRLYNGGRQSKPAMALEMLAREGYGTLEPASNDDNAYLSFRGVAAALGAAGSDPGFVYFYYAATVRVEEEPDAARLTNLRWFFDGVPEVKRLWEEGRLVTGGKPR